MSQYLLVHAGTGTIIDPEDGVYIIDLEQVDVDLDDESDILSKAVAFGNPLNLTTKES